jgi:hypothetical protein
MSLLPASTAFRLKVERLACDQLRNFDGKYLCFGGPRKGFYTVDRNVVVGTLSALLGSYQQFFAALSKKRAA